MTLAGLNQRWRRWKLARQGLLLDRSCMIGQFVSVGPRRTLRAGAVEIGAGCELSNGVELNPWDGRIRIGRRVFIGPYVVVYGQGGVEIGDDSLIAMHCCIVSSDHARSPRARIIRSEPDVLLSTKLGTDVWLGAGVKVMGGVTIGDGCIVGAGAVVTHDLPSYSICVGIPARVIGERE